MQLVMTLIELLQERGIPYREAGGHHHVSSPDFIGVDCCWCSPGSGKFRMGITRNCRAASCWNCGRHGAVLTVAELTGLSPDEVFRLLDFRLLDFSQQEGEGKEKPRGKLTIPNGVGPLLKAHRLYLESRGFDPDEIEKVWGVKGIGQAARLGWRLWIPVTLGGETVSWTTRSLTDCGGRRYITASAEEEKFPAKSVLYGEDKAGRSVIVCEGPIDAWRIGKGAVATLGIEWTQAQAARLGGFARRVICFDAEPDARRQARRLAEALEPMPGQTVVVELETGKDACEADESEILELRKFCSC